MPRRTSGLAASELVAVLVCIDGELKGEIHRIHEGENEIGRDPGCSVCLSDPRISRRHATIVHEDDVVLIIPLAEANPVHRNDRVVDEADSLADGDKIRFGAGSTFRFRTIAGP
jgi:pSer/pThr/pTyr-binding forkhead associated (FHA) protein